MPFSLQLSRLGWLKPELTKINSVHLIGRDNSETDQAVLRPYHRERHKEIKWLSYDDEKADTFLCTALYDSDR